jgi:hypothetical protein
MKPLSLVAMVCEDLSIVKLAKERWNFANAVRVNDPLAIGVEELKRSPLTKPKKKRKSQKLR